MSKAMANKANNRDQASISETRDSAKPGRNFASRNPSSRQNRKPYYLAIGSGCRFRLLTRRHVSGLPFFTHNFSSLYENLPAAEAFASTQRFEFHYTPKAASWLNMIECEFAAISRHCLDRRIPTIERLEKEILTLIKERSEKKIKIDWRFSIEAARSKMNKRCRGVFADNSTHKET
jgi:transposase